MASQICYSYAQRGTCRFGDTCRFRHADGEDAPADSEYKTVARRRPAAAAATSSTARPYAGGRASQLCHQWSDNGACDYGDRCRFLHGEDDPRPSVGRRFVGNAASGGGDSKLFGTNSCYEWAERGTCSHGDRCRFSHVEGGLTYSTEQREARGPCYSHQSNGTCRFGEACKFAHDSNDKVESNQTSGSSNAEDNEKESSMRSPLKTAIAAK